MSSRVYDLSALFFPKINEMSNTSMFDRFCCSAKLLLGKAMVCSWLCPKSSLLSAYGCVCRKSKTKQTHLMSCRFSGRPKEKALGYMAAEVFEMAIYRIACLREFCFSPKSIAKSAMVHAYAFWIKWSACLGYGVSS
jgi:hypothetical protein